MSMDLSSRLDDHIGMQILNRPLLVRLTGPGGLDFEILGSGSTSISVGRFEAAQLSVGSSTIGLTRRQMERLWFALGVALRDE